MSVAIPSLRGAIAVPEWAKNELWRKSRVVPSLDLRFADLKSLVDATTGTNLVTFSRASGGTHVGSDGLIKTAAVNEPRFTHDPVTGESLGLLIEEQRVNLLQKTEEFDDGGIWSTSSLSPTANNALSPNGTTTADSLTSSGTAVASQAITKAASSITYTASLFVNTSTVEELSLTIDDGTTVNRGRAVFTLSSGAHLAVNDGNFTGTISSYEPYGNGWVRLIVSTTTNSATVARFRFFWTGPSTSLAVWGAQLEAGAFPTSYIRNFDTALGVTRQPDLCQISGSAFSSFYNQNAGTVYVKAKAEPSSTLVVVDSGDLTSKKPQIAVGSLSEVSASYVEAGTTVAALNAGTTSSKFKFATSYATDNYAAVLNGGSAATDTLGALPGNATTLRLGQLSNGSAPANGYISRVVYWPQRLSNEIMQVITQ